MRILISLFLLSRLAAAESEPRSRFTFSGGWSRQIGGYSFEKQTATSLGGSYGYRVRKHIEAEAGVFTALQPAPEIRGASYFLDPDDRFIWVPFGLRFILPMHRGRVELSAGGGGLYEKYSVSNANPGLGAAPRNGWGGYFVGGATVALDRGKHFWLGVTPRVFLANPKYARDRWFQLMGEFSFRF